jgi:hypothetical protein
MKAVVWHGRQDVRVVDDDDADPLGSEDLTTHVLPLAEAPRGYEMFQRKEDGCIKVVLEP